MSPLFPSQPAFDPETPADGTPHVRIAGDGIYLEFEDRVVFLPGRSILRHSVVVKPGGNDNVNRVQLDLMVCDIHVDEGAWTNEIRVDTGCTLAEHQALIGTLRA